MFNIYLIETLENYDTTHWFYIENKYCISLGSLRFYKKEINTFI